MQFKGWEEGRCKVSLKASRQYICCLGMKKEKEWSWDTIWYLDIGFWTFWVRFWHSRVANLTIRWWFCDFLKTDFFESHARHYLFFVFSCWSCSLDCVDKICFLNRKKTPKTDGNMLNQRFMLLHHFRTFWRFAPSSKCHTMHQTLACNMPNKHPVICFHCISHNH